MSKDRLGERLQAAADAAQRTNGIARAALIIAVTAFAVGVLGLGLGLPLR